MRLLITGASGFVGKKLLDLIPSEWDVVCLGRSSMEGRLKFVKADLSIKEDMREAAKEIGDTAFDAIVHLAALVPRTVEEDDLSNMIQANVIGTSNLLETFGSMAKKIIIGSTAEVYDQTRIEGVIDEHTNVGPSSYYGVTKLASEQIAQTYAKKHNIETIILRFSIMYGGDDPIARALPNFIRSAIRHEDINLQRPETKRDYIHIDDVALSILAAVKSKKGGVMAIGTGEGRTILEAAEAVVSAADSKSKIVIDSPGKGVDIIIDPKPAKEFIGFVSSIKFPDKLADMVKHYK